MAYVYLKYCYLRSQIFRNRSTALFVENETIPRMMDVHNSLAFEFSLKFMMFIATAAIRLVEPNRIAMEATVVAKWPNPYAVVWVFNGVKTVS